LAVHRLLGSFFFVNLSSDLDILETWKSFRLSSSRDSLFLYLSVLAALDLLLSDPESSFFLCDAEEVREDSSSELDSPLGRLASTLALT